MEINKTYDLEKLHEIVSTAIEDALKTKLFHARIDLISAKEITEILKEEQRREEKRKHIVGDMIKNLTKNFGVLDESMSPVFVEKEHPETEMIEGEIEHCIKIIKDKEKELEELRKHLGYMKEAISDKNEQLNILISENSELEKENEELRGKYEALTTVHYVGEEEQNDCDCVMLPGCYGNFDLANIDCLKCKEKEYCLSEKEEQTKEETMNV